MASGASKAVVVLYCRIARSVRSGQLPACA